MPENFKKDDVSEKRKKYIENLKTRPTDKPSGFWNSRPLGFGMRAWRIFFGIDSSLLYLKSSVFRFFRFNYKKRTI